MSNHAEILVQALREALSEEIHSEEQFAELAATGELLRREMVLSSNPPEGASDILGRYENTLKSMPGKVATRAQARLQDMLGGLALLADRCSDVVDSDQLKVQLDGVDEALSLAAAAGRAGHLTEAKVEALGETARLAIARLAPRLPDVWQYAEDMELAYGPDPDYPGLFSFWEELACMAESRLYMETAIATAYMDPVRRQALYEKAKAILCPEPKESLAERIVKWLTERAEELADSLRVRAPVAATASHYAASGWRNAPGLMGMISGALPVGVVAGLPDITVLAEAPGLISIVQKGKLLAIELPRGSKLTAVKVVADGNPVKPAKTIEKNRIEIPIREIPPNAHIHVSFKLDGTVLELPPIAMPKAKSKTSGKARKGGKKKK
jgi:hypothetical protein